MFIYICFFCFLVLTSIYEIFCRVNRFSIFYIFFLFLFFCVFFVGFRQCGFDYENYHLYFKELNSIYWENNSQVLGAEKGYALLNYLIGDYRILLLVMAGVTILLQFSFIYRYSPFVFFSLLLCFSTSFFPSVMGQYRQALAISIVLWAFVVKNRSLVLSLLLICIASLFHITSFLACIALFLPSVVKSKKIYIVGLMAALFFSLFGENVFYNVMLGGSDFVIRKLAIYTEAEQNTRLGFNGAMLLRILFFMIFIHEKKYIEQFPNGGYFLNLYFVALLMYLGLGFLPQLSGRGSSYFYFFEYILSAMILFNNKKRRTMLFLFFVCIALYRYYSFFQVWYDDYIPYSFGISYF